MTRPTRRGFATILAIAAVGMVAAALAALSLAFAREFAETKSALADAQVQQLLLAGEAQVSRSTESWGNAPPPQGWSVALPSALGADHAQLSAHMHPAPAATAVVELDAQFGNRHAGQELQYHETRAGWRLTAARLLP